MNMRLLARRAPVSSTLGRVSSPVALERAARTSVFAKAPCSSQQLLGQTTRTRPFSAAPTQRAGGNNYDIDEAAKKNNHAVEEELHHYDRAVAEDKESSSRRPWHREGSDQPPVRRNRSAGAMTKGKLLTTPSRLLKLILPLTTRDLNKDRKTIEPLALLVHPQQPLSYLERLIQSELPFLDFDGVKRPPNVDFRAVDAMAEDHMEPKDPDEAKRRKDPDAKEREALQRRRGGHGEGGVESYSGAGHETPGDAPDTADFVRWSKSTEIGDFIRDAARGKEFGVEIEGAPHEVRVGVPSFNDRTYYLRMRLRRRAQQISSMAKLKGECDKLAHQGAQRVAMAGFGGMCGWMVLVGWLTFYTDYGWDTMEPVTYLVGLAGLLGGYGWFLFNRREASYQSAMNLTVSRRQNALYTQRGFDLPQWQQLIDEANAIRREVMSVAAEYDVDWDETMDARDEKVVEALKERRGKKGRKSKDKDDRDDDEDDDED